ncbi:MAG: lytic transglycosylase domain-containing protein [Bryobacteraceae bacterium]
MVFLLVLAAGTLLAQEKPPEPKSARVAMEEALERQRVSISRQRESVRRQVDGAVPGDPGGFTIPWSKNKDGRFLEPPAPIQPLSIPPPGTAVEPLEPDNSPAPAGPVPSRTTAASGCLPMLPSVLDPVIQTAATRNGYPAGILRSVIARESAFDPCAVSTKGALGLMQLMPATATWLGVDDPFDPVQSIEAGARYLGQLLGRYGGDWRRALGAYNAGPSVVDQYGGVPPYAETTRFVENVLNGQ